MPSGKYITWDRVLLEDLYVRQRLTAKVIAVRIGCRETAVRNAIRKLDLTRNPKGTT